VSAYRIRVGRETLSSGAFEWASLDRRGNVLETGSASLETNTLRGACEVVVAAELVLLEKLAVPAAQQRRVAGSLRFLAEDAALTEPERLHVAAEASPGKDVVGVGIVEREWLKEVLERLERAGLVPRSALPESLLPALEPGAWCVVCNGSESFVRTGRIEGFALDSPRGGEAPVALQLAVEKGAPASIVLRAAPGATLPDARRWSAALGAPVEVGEPWHWARFEQRPALELLQREFAPRGAQGGWRQRLLRPAVLAGVLVAVASAGIAADWWAKSREQRALSAEINAVYRETFGEAAVIVDAPLQMQRALAELRSRSGEPSPSDFLPLLGRISEQLDPASQRIEAIAYERGTLSITVRAQDAAQLGQLREALRARAASRGLEVRLDPVDSKGSPALRLTAMAEGGTWASPKQ
jgi:general secretion pathway protein L